MIEILYFLLSGIIFGSFAIIFTQINLVKKISIFTVSALFIVCQLWLLSPDKYMIITWFIGIIIGQILWSDYL